MPLRLLNQQLQHLKPLKDQPKAVLADMVKLVLEYLNNEPPTSNRFSTQAEKLNMSSADLQLTIKALVLLIVETVKKKVTRSDFEETLFACLGPEQLQYFWEFINSQRQFIVNILRHYTVTEDRYRDLEFRVESRIASRSLHTQNVPTITMKLFLDTEEIGGNKCPLNIGDDDAAAKTSSTDTTSAPTTTTTTTAQSTQKRSSSAAGTPSTTREVLFQTDPTNLSHAIEVLEQALDESKNHRTKNFVKSMHQQQQQQQ